MKVEDRIVELLKKGLKFEQVRDKVCIEYSMNHGNYKHDYTKAMIILQKENSPLLNKS